MKIEDGKGKGYVAAVSEDNRLETEAKINSREFYVSRDSGRVFNWTSAYDATTGAIVMHVRNTSDTRNLYINKIKVAAETTCTWNIYLNESAPSGTTITGVNLNATSANVAESDALGNAAVTLATANTATSLVGSIKTRSYETLQKLYSDTLILGRNDGVNIVLTGNGNIIANVEGYFE